MPFVISQQQHRASASNSFSSLSNNSDSFMDPDHPSSLDVENHSRFRPESFVAPVDIELMQGTFTMPGANNILTPQTQMKSRYGWYMSG